jgi:tRNA (guanine37-N1)-methyltransferase
MAAKSKRASHKPLQVDVLTLFPEMFPGYVNASILGRAQKQKLLNVRVHQLRDWTHDRHKTVDDKPFGGGPGMVMKIAPFHEALVALGLCAKKTGRKTAKAKKARVIMTSASGKPFTHADAVRLAKQDRLVFLCGRYEGVDARVTERLADESFRIGEYVLTGGELPALVMMDAIARHRKGVLGKEASLNEESWSNGNGEEYPQYTRPETYLGMKVPPVLLSGDHARIKEWRKEKRA